MLCVLCAAGDRGGVADLITTIKMSKIPIICICNDKYVQKLKSLRNHVRHNCIGPCVHTQHAPPPHTLNTQHTAQRGCFTLDDAYMN